MMDFRLARLLLAYASFDTAEDGSECLHWSLPAGASGRRVEFRAILDGSECLCAEERRVDADGTATAWDRTYPNSTDSYPSTVTEALAVLDALGVPHSRVVGRGFNDSEEDDDIIAERRV